MGLTIALTLVMLCCAAFLGAFFALLRHPPVFHIELGLAKPKLDAASAKAVTENVPMPEDVVAYIDEESEEHARVTRRHRARALFAELGDWEVVFRMLQREDNAS